jgi:hypothetical protein
MKTELVAQIGTLNPKPLYTHSPWNHNRSLSPSWIEATILENLKEPDECPLN